MSNTNLSNYMCDIKKHKNDYQTLNHTNLAIYTHNINKYKKWLLEPKKYNFSTTFWAVS